MTKLQLRFFKVCRVKERVNEVEGGFKLLRSL